MANTLVGSELRKGSGFARKGEGFKLIFGETWHFRVKTDTVTSDRLSILYDTPGLPYAGLMYGPLGLICDEVTCEREEKCTLYWNVTARFQTGTEEQKQPPGQEQTPDPLQWIPIFKIDQFLTKDRVVAFDKSDPPKHVANSAGTPFDEPLVESRTLCVFSFVQFEDPGTSLRVISDRNDCVNNATFTTGIQTFGARTMLLNVAEAELGSYAGYNAWRIKYTITYDPDTHDEKRLDVGPYYLNAGGQAVRAMDANIMFGNMVFLNGSGAIAATPAELNFQTKKPISFSFIRK